MLVEADQRRKSIGTEWISGMEQVVTQARNKRATQIWGFLGENMVLGKPTKEGVAPLEGNLKGLGVTLVVLIKGLDEEVNADILIEGGNAAIGFAPNYNAIIIPADRILTPNWRGFSGLHEGYHAWDLLTNSADNKTLRGATRAERDAYQFEFTLLSALGKKPYQQALDEEARRLRGEILKFGHQIGNWVPSDLDNYSPLDRIFGSPLSEAERIMRSSHFFINAYFHLLDTYFKGNVGEAKLAFTAELYSRSSIDFRRRFADQQGIPSLDAFMRNRPT